MAIKKSRIDPKKSINAPCRYIDEAGKTRYPAVDCAYTCETCGWNPEEIARRKDEGVVVCSMLNGVEHRQLHFPKHEFLLEA